MTAEVTLYYCEPSCIVETRTPVMPCTICNRYNQVFYGRTLYWPFQSGFHKCRSPGWLGPTCFPWLVCFWRDSLQQTRASSLTKFLDHTQRRTTVGRTPLHKWSARRRDLYLITHNTHNRQTFLPPAGFERTQTYALDRAATGTGNFRGRCINLCSLLLCWNAYLLQN